MMPPHPGLVRVYRFNTHEINQAASADWHPGAMAPASHRPTSNTDTACAATTDCQPPTPARPRLWLPPPIMLTFYLHRAALLFPVMEKTSMLPDFFW